MPPAVPQRSEPLVGVTEERSKAPFLHRPVVATGRRGCVLVVPHPRRSLQPVPFRSFKCSRETSTGRATEQKRHQGRRCCPVCAPLSGAAAQSSCQILLAAACLDSET